MMTAIKEILESYVRSQELWAGFETNTCWKKVRLFGPTLLPAFMRRNEVKNMECIPMKKIALSAEAYSIYLASILCINAETRARTKLVPFWRHFSLPIGTITKNIRKQIPDFLEKHPKKIKSCHYFEVADFLNQSVHFGAPYMLYVICPYKYLSLIACTESRGF